MNNKSCADCDHMLPADFREREFQVRHAKCKAVIWKGEPAYVSMARGGTEGDDGSVCGYSAKLFQRKGIGGQTTEEINKYIHETILGKCWHRDELNNSWPSPFCTRCDTMIDDFPDCENPDYCSDTSPRSLLNEVVAKVHPPGHCDCDEGVDFCGMQVDATAEQIARACVAADMGKETK